MGYSRLCDEVISWIDDEFSLKSKQEREQIYESYRWMFSPDCKLVTLESLIVGNDPRVNTFREKFREWFEVVCDYSLNPKFLGMTSYSHYMKDPYWKGLKSKGNKAYPQKVILSLGLTGIFTGVQTNYLHLDDPSLDHGRVYTVDVERLKDWTVSWTPPPEEPWVISSSGGDVDFSFLEGDDDQSRVTWEQHSDWFSQRQYETISSLTVIPEYYEKARQFLSTCTYQDLKGKDNKSLRTHYRNCKWLVNLQNLKLGSCKVDDKGGRFYTVMVGMAKDYRRNCVLLDGEKVVEVDLSSAQPTLIGLKIKKEKGLTTHWLTHCLQGDFYEWVKHVTGTRVTRDKVKKYVMRFLFSCYGSDLPQDYKGEHLPPDQIQRKKGYHRFAQRLSSYLKDNEPEVYNLIESHKRHPYWTDKTWVDSKKKTHKGRWCSPLPVEMQKVEVEFIKACLSRLPEGIKFYTIHDAICVKSSDGGRVRDTMEKVSLEMYGEKISVKVENSD